MKDIEPMLDEELNEVTGGVSESVYESEKKGLLRFLYDGGSRLETDLERELAKLGKVFADLFRPNNK